MQFIFSVSSIFHQQNKHNDGTRDESNDSTREWVAVTAAADKTYHDGDNGDDNRMKFTFVMQDDVIEDN